MLTNCHTCYSFCYGTMKVPELLETLKQLGYGKFALTDINNTSACLETIRLAPGYGLQPVAGIDFRNGVQQQYVGLACNNEGFRELNEHLTHHLHTEKDFTGQAPAFSNAVVIYPLRLYSGQPLRDNEFIGISAAECSGLPFHPARHLPHKLVALQPFSFLNKRQYNAHRLLRAIDNNTLLSKLTTSEQARGDELVMSAQNLRACYNRYPQIIANTEGLLQECDISFEYGKLANKNLRYYTGSAGEDMALLRAECEKGIPYRYPVPTKEVRQRLEKELEVIGSLSFASYYLINWDIIRYARSKDYYYVGRGSGANSIIAYLLRITDVDPIELELYFERFINIYRNNAPDFDIDFSWTDRDDVTRYIFERFGRQHTALLGAYSTLQHDAVIREVGKVFGLPSGEIDRLQKVSQYNDIDSTGKQVLRYSELIRGLPSHLSIHSSGIIISEKPVTCYSATFIPPKGFPTTQFSMLEAEDIGLFKFDILSQRGLGKIKDALAIIRENQGVEIDIHDTAKFKQDEKVKTMLRSGKAIGCFYVESPAMRMLLAKLGADDYLRLVAASSIIRPGVARSGMMREYIVRYRDPAAREKARKQLPELYDILRETYGVMVYQEDVIRVAHLFAGLTLAEADHLRRGMSWKFKQRNEFWRVKESFFNNCRKKNYPEKLVTDIWNQIESFANFAFSKGHSASYAVESYQALYLKAHFPLEYMTATLINGGGFYRAELYIHEARMHGATISKPCVNNSNSGCTIKGRVIYLGLDMISELEQASVTLLITERETHGAYTSLDDFVKRVPLSIEQLRLLIRAGAFNFTGTPKKELLWYAHALVAPVKEKKTAALFEVERKTWKLPALTTSATDEAFDEIALFGFPLCSPFTLLREPPPASIPAREISGYINKKITVTGYLVTIKYTSTIKHEKMYFGTFIDEAGEWIDTVHFPDSARKYPFTGPGCYVIEGRVTEEYGFCTIEVQYMKRLPVIDRG